MAPAISDVVPAGGKVPPRQQAPGSLIPTFEGISTPSDPAAGSQLHPEENLRKLRALEREATKRYAGVNSYIVRLRRREQINGKEMPEEVLLLKFRKEPWSVHFKWLGTEATGREVIYVKGRYEDKIHTLIAAGDIPLMPAGKRVALAPDNPLVRASSRHPIIQAGVGALIDRFGDFVTLMEKGETKLGMLRALGPTKRPEFAAPCELVEQLIPEAAESQLPRGGRRLWGFDPVTRFPALVVTYDDKQREVEYYYYDRFLFPVNLDEDDFSPDKLWGGK